MSAFFMEELLPPAVMLPQDEDLPTVSAAPLIVEEDLPDTEPRPSPRLALPPPPHTPTQLTSYGAVNSADVHNMRNDRVNAVVDRIVGVMDGVEGMDIPPTLGVEAPLRAHISREVATTALTTLLTQQSDHPLSRVIENMRRQMDSLALDPRCEEMLRSFRSATKGLTLHGVLGNSVSDDDVRRFLANVTQYPTYLEASANVMRNCHRRGLSFPYVEPMPVQLEDDFRRPPDPGAPWELECPNGGGCKALDLCANLGVPHPWAARAWVPMYVLSRHWELQASVLSGELAQGRAAREAASLLHQQYGPPLPCVLCQGYSITEQVATCDRDHGAGDDDPYAPPPSSASASSSSSSSIRPIEQCYMHLFDMEGEYSSNRMIPGVGRFVGLVAPLAEFCASGFVYVSEAHPRLLGDGPNLPAFRLSADMLFR